MLAQIAEKKIIVLEQFVHCFLQHRRQEHYLETGLFATTMWQSGKIFVENSLKSELNWSSLTNVMMPLWL